MRPFALQIGVAFTLTTLFVLVLLIATVLSAVETVPPHEQRALTVFGEYQRMLQPGLHFVPPFVSRTYPVDVRTQESTLTVDDARTRDGEAVAVDLLVEARVVDPEAAFLASDDHGAALRDLAQSAVYDAVREREASEVRRYPGDVGGDVDRALADVGETGWAVERVAVEDLRPAEEVASAG